jgi:hypothetical protein
VHPEHDGSAKLTYAPLDLFARREREDLESVIEHDEEKALIIVEDVLEQCCVLVEQLALDAVELPGLRLGQRGVARISTPDLGLDPVQACFQVAFQTAKFDRLARGALVARQGLMDVGQLTQETLFLVEQLGIDAGSDLGLDLRQQVEDGSSPALLGDEERPRRIAGAHEERDEVAIRVLKLGERRRPELGAHHLGSETLDRLDRRFELAYGKLLQAQLRADVSDDP